MKQLVQRFAIITIFSIASTAVYSTSVYYTFSPFVNLKGVGVILDKNHIYGNLDLKINYEKHILDSYRPNIDEDHFFWDYAFNIGGGYKHNSFLFGAEVGYLNRTKTFLLQFQDATTHSHHFLYGVNLALIQHKLFFGVKVGNIEIVNLKVGFSF